MPALVVKSGPLAGSRQEITGETVIGRRDADIALDDEEVSRRHAVVRLAEDGVVIEDSGSLNGTWVNGTRIEAATILNAGDSVRVGATSFEVELEEERDDRTVLSGSAGDETRLATPPTAVGTPRPSETEPTAAPGPAPAASYREAPAPPADRGPAPPPAPVPAPSVEPPSAPFDAGRPARSRRRRVATRRAVPTLLSAAAVVGTAVALVVYFAAQ